MAETPTSTPNPPAGDPARCAVLGDPVDHSLSPEIHAAFAQAEGVSLRYDKRPCSEAALPALLEELARDGYLGLNLTAPLKRAALALAASASTAAQRAGAANMLTRDGARWVADNSDGQGFLIDIADHHGVHVGGRRVLLIGAGGAAAAVIPALIDAGCDELIIVNRTPARADALVDQIGEPDQVKSRYIEDLDDIGSFDLVLNATSAGRAGGLSLMLPADLFAPRCVAYDLNYGEASVVFIAAARAAGVSDVFDGLGMLVEQAAIAFERWHGHHPATAPVHRLLEARAGRLATGD